MKNYAFTLGEVFSALFGANRKKDMRIIRVLAGVTSGSTRLAGLACARTAPYLKSAFTLAEVLITLGIIGVVAAMTLPTLVQKQQEKAWVTAYPRVNVFFWMMC